MRIPIQELNVRQLYKCLDLQHSETMLKIHSVICIYASSQVGGKGPSFQVALSPLLQIQHATKQLSHDSSVRPPRHCETSFGGCFESIYKSAEYALSALFRVLFCFCGCTSSNPPPFIPFLGKELSIQLYSLLFLCFPPVKNMRHTMYNIARIYGCQTGRAPGMASLETQAAMVIIALYSDELEGGGQDKKVRYVRKISKNGTRYATFHIYAKKHMNPPIQDKIELTHGRS